MARSTPAATTDQSGTVLGGEDDLWSVDGPPGLTPWFLRPTPVPVEGRWLVDGAAGAVTSALVRWVLSLHGEVVRPVDEGVVAQFGAALLYRASSKNGVPGRDKVPVRLKARVTTVDGPPVRAVGHRCRQPWPDDAELAVPLPGRPLPTPPPRPGHANGHRPDGGVFDAPRPKLMVNTPARVKVSVVVRLFSVVVFAVGAVIVARAHAWLAFTFALIAVLIQLGLLFLILGGTTETVAVARCKYVLLTSSQVHHYGGSDRDKGSVTHRLTPRATPGESTKLVGARTSVVVTGVGNGIHSRNGRSKPTHDHRIWGLLRCINPFLCIGSRSLGNGRPGHRFCPSGLYMVPQ